MTAKATSDRPPRLIDVTVVLLERALPSSAVAPIEIFGTVGVALADDPRPAARAAFPCADGVARRAADPAHGAAAPPPRRRRSPRTPDRPRSSSRPRSSTWTPPSRANAALIPWLRRWHARGASIAGICTGVSLLAEAGLLDGRPATTHWAMVESFRRRYPRVDWQPERFVTESGRVFCGGGVYSAIDLSLYLVEKYCGHEVAVQTAKALLLETPRIWQSGYGTAPPRSAHDDEGIQKAQDWLFRNFKQEVNLAELAARVGMSPRNFARRFTVGDRRDAARVPAPPAHRRRPPSAGDAAAQHRRRQPRRRIRGHRLLPALFKRHTGAPPRAYRARFGPRPRAAVTAAAQGSARRTASAG